MQMKDKTKLQDVHGNTAISTMWQN